MNEWRTFRIQAFLGSPESSGSSQCSVYKLDVLLTTFFALCVHKLRINSTKGKGVLHSLEDYTIINSPKCTTQSQWSQKTGSPGPIIKYRNPSSLFLSKQTLFILEISTTLPLELLLFSRYQDLKFCKSRFGQETGSDGSTFTCPPEETGVNTSWLTFMSLTNLYLVEIFWVFLLEKWSLLSKSTSYKRMLSFADKSASRLGTLTFQEFH